jgi:hypothetical protein
LLQPEPNV